MKAVPCTAMRYAAAALVALPAALAAISVPSVAAHHAADASTEIDGPNLLVNGGFERGADPGVHFEIPPGQTPLLAGWTVINRYVQYIGTYWKAEEGTRSLNLSFDGNGVLTTASGVKQSFPTVAGQRYRLVFYQGAYSTTPTTLRVTIAGQTHDYTYQAGPTGVTSAAGGPYTIPWVKRTFTFAAAATGTTVEFDALYSKGYPLGLDNVQVRAIQPPAAGDAPTPGPGTGVVTGTLTLQIAAPALAAGGKQTVQGTAAKGAAVGLVVDYPDGTQLLAPLKAGPDGRYTDTWTVPASVHGLVHVLVDSAGISTHGSFTVQ